MNAIEVVMALLFLVLGGIVIKTDIQSGVIRNKTLMLFLLIAVVLDTIYYGFYVRDIMLDFVVNLVTVCVIGLILFYTHSFAGGDCKLSVVYALMYPGRYYIAMSYHVYTLYIAIGLGIFFGYIYLVVKTLYKLFSGKSRMTRAYIKKYIIAFAKSFLVVLIYVSGITLITLMINTLGIDVNVWAIRIVCIVIAWLISKYKWMKKGTIVGFVLAIDITLSFIMHVIPITTNPSNYILAIVLLFCQMSVRTELYEEIDVKDLKKGMILSMGSSMLMQGSRIRGLPKVSSEDLRDRLSDLEVKSIKKWASSRELDHITVVRKIPFAIFLTLGYLTYFLIWSVFR